MPKKKQKSRHWLSHLSFGSVALTLSVLLILSYLSIFIDPAKAWFFTLFGLLYPVVLPMALVLFVWALIRRSHMRTLLFLALLPSLFFAGRYIQFGNSRADEAQTSLKVVSYNAGLFAHGPKDAKRMDLAEDVSSYLMSTDADIICLQEFFLPTGVSADQWISKHFPGYHAEYYVFVGKTGRFGNLTLSKRPIVGKGKISFEKSTNLALWTDVKLDSSTVRIYNCHLESYNISLSALATRNGAVEETERKMKRSITERPKQVAEVLRGIDSAPVRSLVVGDFNDTPLSYTYFRLLRGRKDSFAKAGHGLGATHRALWPMLRIDYILYPADLEIVSCDVGRVEYSDHYPITASYYETGRNSR